MKKDTLKATWLKAHPKFGYFPGDVCELSAEQFAELKKSKHIAEFVAPAKVVVNDLPADLPGRDALMAFGIQTMAEIKAIKDFTEIKGIGKSTHAQIVEYLEIAL